MVHHWNSRNSLFSFILCSIIGDPTWNTVISLCDSLVKKVDIVICCIILCIYCILSVSILGVQHIIRSYGEWCVIHLLQLPHCHWIVIIVLILLRLPHIALVLWCWPAAVWFLFPFIDFHVLTMPVRYLGTRHCLFAIMNNDYQIFIFNDSNQYIWSHLQHFFWWSSYLLARFAVILRNFRLLPQSRWELHFLDSRPLKMGPMGCPNTSVRNYFYFLHNNPEECSSLAVGLLVKVAQVSTSKLSRDFILLCNYVIFTFLIATEQLHGVFIKFRVSISNVFWVLRSSCLWLNVTWCDVVW